MPDIVPWLNVQPSQFVQAAGAGAQAGLEAGGQIQRGQIAGAQIAQETARTALAAKAQQDRINLEQQQLGQQATIAEMEMQARKDIAEKAAIRQSQEIALENAYRQAQIGLHAQNLQRESMVANQKIQEAAMAHQDQMGYAQARAAGMSNQEALMRYPRTPHSFVSSYSGGPGEYGDVEVQQLSTPEGKLLGYAIGKKGAATTHYESAKDEAQKHQFMRVEYSNILKGVSDPLLSPQEKAKLQTRKSEIESEIYGGAAPAGAEKSAAAPAARPDGTYYSKKTDTTYVIQGGKTVRSYKGRPKAEGQESFEGSMAPPLEGPATAEALRARMG